MPRQTTHYSLFSHKMSWPLFIRIEYQNNSVIWQEMGEVTKNHRNYTLYLEVLPHVQTLVQHLETLESISWQMTGHKGWTTQTRGHGEAVAQTSGDMTRTRLKIKRQVKGRTDKRQPNCYFAKKSLNKQKLWITNPYITKEIGGQRKS